MKKIPTKKLVLLAFLVALEIVFSRFLSINAWNLKIGFNFLPIALAALLFGPLAGGLVGALGDFLGALLFPIGTYFPGFTFTAFLTGCCFGLFLGPKTAAQRGSAPWLSIGGAVLVNQLFLSLLLNSFWISVLYGSPYGPLLVTRLIQCAVLLPVQFAGLWLLLRMLPRLRKEMKL